MKNFLFFPVWSFLIFLPSSLFSYDPATSVAQRSRMIPLESSLTLQGAVFPLQIYVFPEHRTWGEELLSYCQKGIPVLVGKLGIPPGFKGVLVTEDNNLPSMEWYGGEEGVFLKYPADPLDLMHGVLHYWFSKKVLDEPWMYEGISLWEGIKALRDGGFSDLAQVLFEGIVREGVESRIQKDFPLGGVDLHRESPERYRFGIIKSALFFMLLETSLTPSVYQGWITTIPFLPQGVTGGGIRDQIRALGRTPEPLFRGWIDPPPYEAFGWDLFSDEDRDGIPDGIEALFGTRKDLADTDGDGVGDGYEVFHGLDPLRKSTREGKSDVSTVGIAIDGFPEDWDIRQIQKKFSDRKGDGDRVDITNFYLVADGRFLYLRWDLSQPVPPGTLFLFQVQVDFYWERKGNLVVTCTEKNECYYTLTQRNEPPPSYGKRDPRLLFRYNRVVEMRIPIEFFQGNPTFRINVQVLDPQTRKHLDHMGQYWLPVEITKIVLP